MRKSVFLLLSTWLAAAGACAGSSSAALNPKEPDGTERQRGLVIVDGTRKEAMMKLPAVFYKSDAIAWFSTNPMQSPGH
jgi:hypothetical protein